jgi:AcrR family transcriptional regulator
VSRRAADATTASSRSRSSASRRTASADEARPRRTRAKRGQGDQLREQILDATYELLVETGDADRVSTRAVARRVGCSSPALYLHFPDRASLLWAACNRQFVKLGDVVRLAVEGIDDPIDALQAAGRAYITFGVEHAEEYRVMMMTPETVVWNPPIEDLPGEAGFDVLHQLIERAMADGALRDDDPSLVALSVWAAVHGIVALRIAKPSFDWPPLEDDIDRMIRLVTGGLAGSTGSS